MNTASPRQLTPCRSAPRTAFAVSLVFALMVSALGPVAAMAQAPTGDPPSPQQVQDQDPQTQAPGPRALASPLEVYAHTLRYRDPAMAADVIRHRLSPRGTLEVQPSANTLVVRDIAPILVRVKPMLVEFDQPPATVRLELRVVKAGPKSVVSPPLPEGAAVLPPALLDKLRSLLRYDSYRVLAETAVSSLEGEAVDYSLGPDYSVSFTVGSVLAQRRLHVEDFRIVERLSSDKGRGLDPKQLFHADLNLWMNRPFTLVLTRDEARQEALLVAITGRLEERATGSTPER